LRGGIGDYKITLNKGKRSNNLSKKQTKNEVLETPTTRTHNLPKSATASVLIKYCCFSTLVP